MAGRWRRRRNWAPGKAAELGLDSADLMRVNPALVYAYAGGWGHDRPGEPLPGTDFMVQAWSGVGEQIGQASATPGGSLFTIKSVPGSGSPGRSWPQPPA